MALATTSWHGFFHGAVIHAGRLAARHVVALSVVVAKHTIELDHGARRGVPGVGAREAHLIWRAA